MLDNKELEAPSEKQYNFAKAISEELDIPLPEKFSKHSYSNFISNNINKFKRSRQKYEEIS